METVGVTMIPFKLYDDDQLKQLMLSLNQAAKVSDTTLFSELGLDYNKEQDHIKHEQVAKAKMQIELQYDTEQAQILAAKGKGQEMNDNEETKTILQKSQGIAEQLYAADEGTRRSFLAQLKTEDYTQWLLVSKILEEAKKSEEHQQATQEGVQGVAQDQNSQGNLNTNADSTPAQQG
jgi:hypothetical protein